MASDELNKESENPPEKVWSEDELRLFSQRNQAINMNSVDTNIRKKPWYSDIPDKLLYFYEDHYPLDDIYLSVADYADYISRPRSERMVWGLFYKSASIQRSSFLSKEYRIEDKKVDDYLKKKYPIQFWLREKVLWRLSPRSLRSYWYDYVDSVLNPKQKWLTKKIPKTWSDKTYLIQLVNFEMVVNFVEDEVARDIVDWEASSDLHVKFYKELMDCYDYIKVRRPQLEKDHDNSYPNEDTKTGIFDIDYKENTRLELLIDSEDTKYLTWIVVNRGFMWT